MSSFCISLFLGPDGDGNDVDEVVDAEDDDEVDEMEAEDAV